MSTSDDRFAQARAQREREKAEEANRGNGGGFIDIPQSALILGVDKVIRLRGGPALADRLPTDCKRINMSMILGDGGKKFRCIAPSAQERKDWILHKVYNAVMSYTWNPEGIRPDGKKGVRDYHHANTHPDLYNRVSKNNNLQNQYESGWKFSELIIWNIIDRDAMDWHRENKKCRILSKKSSVSNDGNVWFDVGVPKMVYDLIVDDILAMDGNTNWENYDIAIKKLDDQPWYKVNHGIDDVKRLSEEARAKVVAGPLTAEELSWELHDLDKLYPITSYTRIKSELGLFIQQVDKALGKDFYSELCALVEVEEAQKAKAKAEKAAEAPAPAEESTTPQPVVSETPAAPAPVEQAPVAPQPAATQETPTSGGFAPRRAAEEPTEPKVVSKMTPEKWAGLIDGTLTGVEYKGVALMSDAEKALVIDINLEDGTFVWHPNVGRLIKGESSNFPAPECVSVDPFDGTKFDPNSVTPMPSL